MKLLYIFPLLLIFNGCESTLQVKNSNDRIEREVSQIKDDQTLQSDPYVKPDDWVTIRNDEFHFSIDVPGEWTNISPSGISTSWASEGMAVGPGGFASGEMVILFTIVDEVDGKELSQEKAFAPIEGNDELIQSGGEAFRYFHKAYGAKNTHPFIGTDSELATEPRPIARNIIFASPGLLTGDDLKTVETIIKSFQKN